MPPETLPRATPPAQSDDMTWEERIEERLLLRQAAEAAATEETDVDPWDSEPE